VNWEAIGAVAELIGAGGVIATLASRDGRDLGLLSPTQRAQCEFPRVSLFATTATSSSASATAAKRRHDPARRRADKRFKGRIRGPISLDV
jgi:hypothetical protein